MTNLIIDGINYTELTEGLDKYDFLIAENEAKVITRSISTEFTLKGDAYEKIKQAFFSTCHGFLNEVPAELRLDLCGETVFIGKITAEGAKINRRKKIATVYFKGESKELDAYTRLSTDYIWDNGFIESKELPIVYYTLQASMAWVLLVMRMVMAGGLAPITILVRTLVGTTEAICRTINLIIKAWNNTNFLLNFLDIKPLNCPSAKDVDPLDGLLEMIDNHVTGNGRWVPVLLVREAIEYQCTNLGISFVSSILNNPSSSRYNMSIFSIEGGKHGDFRDTSAAKRREVFEANKPLLTTFQYLDSIKDAFYAEYRIIGNTLFFEPADFFDQFRTNEIEKQQCPDLLYSYSQTESYAYAQLSYETDYYDIESSRVLNPWHAEKLEFNSPPIEAQKGVKVINMPYSPARFQFDQVSADRTGFFDVDLPLDEFKAGSGFRVAIGGLTIIGKAGLLRYNDMVISSHATKIYKLLILEDNFNRSDAQIVKRELSSYQHWFFGTRKFYEYNYPLYFNEESAGNLSTDFIHRWNPRISNRNMKIDDITIDCDCAAIDAIVKFPHSVYVQTDDGKAIPRTFEIKIDHNNNTAKILLGDFFMICG